MGADLPSGASPPDGAPPLWREVLVDVQRRLAGNGRAPEEARWMVAEVSGIEDDAGLDAPTKVSHIARLDSLVTRRLSGEPLQYVLGRWSFRGLDLMVDRRVLIPRPETEVVAGYALEECGRVAGAGTAGDTVYVADLGCGSGAIGFAVAAEQSTTQVWCTDVSAEALAVAGANLAGLGLPARRVNLAQGSWFSALPSQMAGRFDVIVSNPPYVGEGELLSSEVEDWEPPAAFRAGPHGTEDLDHLVDQASEWLTADGSLVLEVSPLLAEAVAGRASTAGYREVYVHPDLTGRDRVVVARGPR
ncbi:MAG: peptide chain release factor N(5)-glutamine methyltransferase [Actinomycetota bacterium]|nr:peptide chain release factor N(5)-glutamine methyltransferase [Actinomycetota bacterium]